MLRRACTLAVCVALLGACGGSPVDPSRQAGTSGSSDRDGDGFVDSIDKCPTQPETKNGVFDKDGCPDQPSDLYLAVKADVDTFWSVYFGTVLFRPYTPANMRIFTGSAFSLCGSGSGPFYCGLDFTVYLDDRFMSDQLVRIGDFAPAVVIAHEIGHHTQNLVGALGQISIQKELQADCLAGGWAASAGARGLLDPGDFQEAARSLFEAADLAGTPWFAPNAHGTPAQRYQAFLTGFQRGAFFCV